MYQCPDKDVFPASSSPVDRNITTAQDSTTPSHPTAVSGFTTSCPQTTETHLIGPFLSFSTIYPHPMLPNTRLLGHPLPPHENPHTALHISFLVPSPSPPHLIKPFHGDLWSSRGVVGTPSIMTTSCQNIPFFMFLCSLHFRLSLSHLPHTPGLGGEMGAP